MARVFKEKPNISYEDDATCSPSNVPSSFSTTPYETVVSKKVTSRKTPYSYVVSETSHRVTSFSIHKSDENTNNNREKDNFETLDSLKTCSKSSRSKQTVSTYVSRSLTESISFYTDVNFNTSRKENRKDIKTPTTTSSDSSKSSGKESLSGSSSRSEDGKTAGKRKAKRICSEIRVDEISLVYDSKRSDDSLLKSSDKLTFKKDAKKIGYNKNADVPPSRERKCKKKALKESKSLKRVNVSTSVSTFKTESTKSPGASSIGSYIYSDASSDMMMTKPKFKKLYKRFKKKRKMKGTKKPEKPEALDKQKSDENGSKRNKSESDANLSKLPKNKKTDGTDVKNRKCPADKKTCARDLKKCANDSKSNNKNKCAIEGSLLSKKTSKVPRAKTSDLSTRQVFDFHFAEYRLTPIESDRNFYKYKDINVKNLSKKLSKNLMQECRDSKIVARSYALNKISGSFNNRNLSQHNRLNIPSNKSKKSSSTTSKPNLINTLVDTSSMSSLSSHSSSSCSSTTNPSLLSSNSDSYSSCTSVETIKNGKKGKNNKTHSNRNASSSSANTDLVYKELMSQTTYSLNTVASLKYPTTKHFSSNHKQVSSESLMRNNSNSFEPTLEIVEKQMTKDGNIEEYFNMRRDLEIIVKHLKNTEQKKKLKHLIQSYLEVIRAEMSQSDKRADENEDPVKLRRDWNILYKLVIREINDEITKERVKQLLRNIANSFKDRSANKTSNSKNTRNSSSTDSKMLSNILLTSEKNKIYPVKPKKSHKKDDTVSTNVSNSQSKSSTMLTENEVLSTSNASALSRTSTDQTTHQPTSAVSIATENANTNKSAGSGTRKENFDKSSKSNLNSLSSRFTPNTFTNFFSKMNPLDNNSAEKPKKRNKNNDVNNNNNTNESDSRVTINMKKPSKKKSSRSKVVYHTYYSRQKSKLFRPKMSCEVNNST
ncbi:hypothetical protein HELRODRAFT_167442 [Helobdella robusta]|uniref:Uncharacterized protein n=1 Tax=Helobdella robusta TaxID=6412 RepID=T1EZE0_HELRO|nr:hypothetical protein HELRODRAFT_167442 [Helobdella robusta]ESO10927.1 hypothetical protein HELRODRAFT_167442 [Helobdella robusta]